jgi:HTH-type transcriptional repressor of NAD biosynthesis genes
MNGIGETLEVGLIIGKFYPPHGGHQFLIETALAQVDLLNVVICERPDQTISGELRAAWIRELYPKAHVQVVPDICDDENSKRWADYAREFLGSSPDVVFTSEDYGQRFAEFLGCKHILVDRERSQFPISGTEIRKFPLLNLEWLAPCVRAYFVKRVCIVGAESTGTTTLARDLAEHYSTNWVSEYGREVSEERLAAAGRMEDVKWSTDDFIRIARTQSVHEDRAAREASRVLICDTDALATAVWHERYVGFWSPKVAAVSAGRRYDLYILTDCDIPFVQDGTRDGERLRRWMTERFKDLLTKRGSRWLIVSGDKKTRLELAVAAIDPLLV